MTHFIVKWPIFFLITQSNKQLYFQHSVGLGNQNFLKTIGIARLELLLPGLKYYKKHFGVTEGQITDLFLPFLF